jgi:hypothetical protein
VVDARELALSAIWPMLSGVLERRSVTTSWYSGTFTASRAVEEARDLLRRADGLGDSLDDRRGPVR